VSHNPAQNCSDNIHS